jgi:preprotein translocase subunit SecG
MLTTLILIIHIIVCIALILIVLLQTGKGADMGAVFGGAGSQTLFGNTGATTFLGKLTTGAAIIFMVTSLSLAYISKSNENSIVSDVKPTAQETQNKVSDQQLPPGSGETTSVPVEATPGSGDTTSVPVETTPGPEASVPVSEQSQPAEAPPADAAQTPVQTSGN